MSQTEKLLGNVLLLGVLLSAGVVTCGGGVYLLRHGHERVHYRVFRGEPSDLCSLRGAVNDARNFSGRGIIQMGLILLVAVQVIRVIMTGFLFFFSKDRAFVLISLIVLALLGYGLMFEG